VCIAFESSVINLIWIQKHCFTIQKLLLLYCFKLHLSPECPIQGHSIQRCLLQNEYHSLTLVDTRGRRFHLVSMISIFFFIIDRGVKYATGCLPWQFFQFGLINYKQFLHLLANIWQGRNFFANDECSNWFLHWVSDKWTKFISIDKIYQCH